MTIPGAHITRTVDLSGIDQRHLFGQHSNFFRLVETQFDVKLVARGETISIEGDKVEVEAVNRLLVDMMIRIRTGHELSEQYLMYAIDLVKDGGKGPAEILNEKTNGAAALITPKTVGQKDYIEAIEKFDIVFSIGPAGT